LTHREGGNLERKEGRKRNIGKPQKSRWGVTKRRGVWLTQKNLK